MLTDVVDLRLVNPGFDGFDRVLISAPSGAPHLGRVSVVSTWEEAIEGVEQCVAFTARGRHERQGRGRLDETVTELASTTGRFAFVFGREDCGLPNAIVDRCDRYVCLESSGVYSSFNLAQAVMIALHRAMVVMGEPVAMKEPSKVFERASHDALDRMMQTAEDALEGMRFFKGDQRENVLRTIRRVLLRAEVDTQELATFWAFFAKAGRLAGLVHEAPRDVDEGS